MLSVNLNRNPPWSSGVPFEILKALGGADKTLIVGGAVRDWLCDESIGDIDFATKLPPNESLQLLLDSGFNVKPTGIDHGTITVYSDNNSYEITSLRKDILTDGRHAKVLFGGTWEEDANRRDFTVNALYSDEYGRILDFTGQGFKDLENKTLRFIGNPIQRIKEDYLRLLRYFRFLSRFLDNIDNDSMNACIKLANKLNLLSYDRLLMELDKIFTSKNSDFVLNKIIENNIFSSIFLPVLIDNYKLKNTLLRKLLFKFKDYKNRKNYPFILYVSFIITLLPQKEIDKNIIILSIIKKFKLSNDDKRLLTRNVNWLTDIDNINKAEIIKLWLDFGESDVQDLKDILLLTSNKIKNDFMILLHNPPPNFPVSGKDLLNIGFKEGKEVGEKLNEIRDWWISKGCKPSHKECLSKAMRS
ncbi:MAG: hypothetical protein CMJ11_01870 [Pelagibacterales bacterium]|nr:hypothetical protein [Pelagibacterales bacterium]